jgi:Nucleotidyl transferase AbiEii toxin, Type IV TA system
VTPEQEAVVGLVRLLERLGIPHMVTGSVASSYHGRPRLTHDADVVVDPTAGQLEELLSGLLAEGHYVDPAHARDALRRRLQFNVVDARSAFKVDLIVRKERPFSREELDRRRSVDFLPGVRVSLASAEDTILSKLEWAMKAGRSEKQIEDAAGVLAVNPGIDRAYVERWAAELGVSDLWRQLSGETRD